MKSEVKHEKRKNRRPSGKGRGDADSRQRILEAAVALFARNGYGATGMRELASAANVNLAMVNYFFGSKKGLLKEILDDFFSGYLRVAREQLQRQVGTREKLEGFIVEAVRYFGEQRDGLVVAITELPHDDPEVIEHKAAWGRQMMALLGEALCEPLSAGRERPLSPQLIGPLLTSMMASRFLFAPVTERLGNGGAESSVEDYARELSALVLDGLLRDN